VPELITVANCDGQQPRGASGKGKQTAGTIAGGFMPPHKASPKDSE